MVRPDDRPLILLNAAHALTGGALTYLQNIVRELERYPDFRWILLAPKQTLDDIKIPSSWMVIARPPQSFFALHMWEQVVLPMLARRRGVSAVLCNAGFVPFAAPSPIPIVHTSATDGLAQAETWSARLYWRTLLLVTELSLWRSPCVLLTARHLSQSLQYAHRSWPRSDRPARRTNTSPATRATR